MGFFSCHNAVMMIYGVHTFDRECLPAAAFNLVLLLLEIGPFGLVFLMKLNNLVALDQIGDGLAVLHVLNQIVRQGALWIIDEFERKLRILCLLVANHTWWV